MDTNIDYEILKDIIKLHPANERRAFPYYFHDDELKRERYNRLLMEIENEEIKTEPLQYPKSWEDYMKNRKETRFEQLIGIGLRRFFSRQSGTMTDFIYYVCADINQWYRFLNQMMKYRNTVKDTHNIMLRFIILGELTIGEAIEFVFQCREAIRYDEVDNAVLASVIEGKYDPESIDAALKKSCGTTLFAFDENN